MKFRTWLNIITVILLLVVVYFGWDQLVQAWGLMKSVNLWVFTLLIPVQLLSYYATGEVMFSYLRSKGNLKNMSRWAMTRTALELNFVNHIVPVPSIAGFSYLGWILKHHKVSAGRATMAQIIRFTMMFLSFVVLILIAAIALIYDHGIDRNIIAISVIFTLVSIGSLILLIYLISSRKRLISVSDWLTKNINRIVLKITRGKKRKIIKQSVIEDFMIDLHQDYLEIRRDKKMLTAPFVWSTASNIFDVTLIAISFMALGFWVNPAVLCIAFGVASFAAIFAATPGGSGVYEAIMIAFLGSAGVPASAAIAGTLLVRATLFACTIIFGYIFYQLTINKYGKIDKITNNI